MSAPASGKHRIFVYGSLRSGEYNHGLISHSNENVKVCDGTLYGAILKSLGAYPAIIPSDNDGDSVVGEVWDLEPRTFKMIEGMELGAGYVRRNKAIDVHEAETDGLQVAADAYFYADPTWLGGMKTIESGDWLKRHEKVA